VAHVVVGEGDLLTTTQHYIKTADSAAWLNSWLSAAGTRVESTLRPHVTRERNDWQGSSSSSGIYSYACSLVHSELSWWGLKSYLQLHVAHMHYCSHYSVRSPLSTGSHYSVGSFYTLAGHTVHIIVQFCCTTQLPRNVSTSCCCYQYLTQLSNSQSLQH
jgi:hypothetical protein